MTLEGLRNYFISYSAKDEVIVIDYDSDEILHRGRAEFIDCIPGYGPDAKVISFSSEYPIFDDDQIHVETMKGFIILVRRSL